MLTAYSGDSAAPEFVPPLGPGGGRPSRQPRVLDTLLDDRVGPGFLLCTAEPLDPGSPAARWWMDRAVVLDATTTPTAAEILEGCDSCVVRPDRYVMVRGTVGEVTSFASSTLGPVLSI